MTEDAGLFPVDHLRRGPAPTPVAEHQSAGQRLTAKQRRYVDAGLHPLRIVADVRRHPGTKGGIYLRNDTAGRDLTCGTCVFRDADQYPKCMYPTRPAQPDVTPHRRGLPRVTGGLASDCRAWWPACTNYEKRTP